MRAPGLFPENDRKLMPDRTTALILGVYLLESVMLAAFTVSVLARYRVFGAVPDLMLAFTLAVSFIEGGRYGAVCGLVAGMVSYAAGGDGITLLPIFYTLTGLLGAYCQKKLLTGTFLSAAAVSCAACLVRSCVTFITYTINLKSVNLLTVLNGTVLPELFGTALFFFPTAALTYLFAAAMGKIRKH